MKIFSRSFYIYGKIDLVSFGNSQSIFVTVTPGCVQFPFLAFIKIFVQELNVTKD